MREPASSPLANPVKITTTGTTRHDFWLVSPDGDELCINLVNLDFNVRDGQIVSAVWGGKAGTQTGPYILFRNLSAQADTWVLNRKTLLQQLGFSDPLMRAIPVGVGLFLLLIYLGVSGGGALETLATMLGWLVIPAALIIGSRRREAKGKELQEAVNQSMVAEFQNFDSRRQLYANAAAKLGAWFLKAASI
jgi:hypothetical protein